MPEPVCLPNLPGYKARMPLGPGDRRHYKKTTLTYLRGYAVDETPVHADLEPPPEMTKGNLTEQPSTSANSAAHDVSKGPKWLQNDKKVLRWFGYFKEAVPESPLENHRVRRLVICHYLADDTTEALEPKVANSGIWQGAFIKRHKILKADGSFLSPCDIRVRDNLSLYGRVIRVVDADHFTRKFLNSLGVALEDAEEYPVDQFRARQETIQVQKTGTVAHGSGNSSAGDSAFLQQGRLQAYILNSKKVLRFYCTWDDRQNLYGDRRPLRLNFYLEDGTAEILEVHEQNMGRAKFPVFLRRSHLPKDPEAARAGSSTDCNLYFGLEDFRIGTFVHIYGRDFFLQDCDDFTRQWYQDNLGYTADMMAAVDVREAVPETRPRTLPPYNGYGSLEDSAENCKHLIPRPPRKDFYKLINKSKIVLRFGGRLLDTPAHRVPEHHRERQFVVSYFMADDSISIFEHPTDGFSGGKFLERGPVPKAGAPLGVNLTDKDLFVGAKLLPYNHAFELHSADEYTLQYMENNCHEYEMANWKSALAAAKDTIRDGGDAIRAALVEVDSSASGKLPISALAEVFRLAAITLTLHQVISIHRRLSKSTGSLEISVGALLKSLDV